MTSRLETLFSLVKGGKVFADVGCDHGLVAKMALDSGKFESVIISDISTPSLQKAINLLKDYGDKVKAFSCDGLDDFDGLCDVVFIAGMGGEEICSIIKKVKNKPSQFVLSPQKNTEKVRQTLIEYGYKIERDFTFYDKKYYDGISAVLGSDSYTSLELTFGRENLKDKGKAFVDKLKAELNMIGEIKRKADISSVQLELLKNRETLIKKVLYDD